ncbi:MAG TPA: 1-acyl-sn-glycerol-3-phosphate acyltransferase [Candidatus Saccharimonadales bacterium]|nr:1-acyl-sn-glycerol-3-phosphate acyltransferase [Candidatus Saccharimonadales bacterium]
MSQESPDFRIDVPNPNRWRIAKFMGGIPLAARHKITHNDLSVIPVEGPGVSISNHRSDKKDVKSLGWVLRKWRTPYIPAKNELDHSLKGWIMRGSGAMFFNRDDPESRKQVYEDMGVEVAAGHHVHIFLEETSKNRGPELGPITPSPVLLAMEAGLDRIGLVGIGGTENPDSKHIHLEFGELSLQGLKSIVEVKKQLDSEGKSLSLREAAIIMAQTEDVALVSDAVLDSIANPDSSKRRGQRRERKGTRDPENLRVSRLMLYSLFTEQVVRPKLQEHVDIAWVQAA